MTLFVPDPENSPASLDPSVNIRDHSEITVAAFNDAYLALQAAYGEAAALSTTTDQQDRWRTQSQRLRHLRLRVGDADLYFIVTATSAFTAERKQVQSSIDSLVSDRSSSRAINPRATSRRR